MKLGEIFGKEPVRDAHGLHRAWEFGQHGAASRRPVSVGLVTGTQVATGLGWRKIEAVQEGDKVLTFDDGLQTVRRIERNFVAVSEAGDNAADAPICVPAGALGNREALRILPDQPVMVESDLGEEMFGDPFTLVPALALIGYKNIRQQVDPEIVEVITLYFDTEQVVFANVGALFYCPAYAGGDLLDMIDESYAPGYEVLSPEKARALVSAMIHEESQDAVWAKTARENRPLHVVA
ncbi:Hint domain-containing protein [Celeribacter sp.]|uniref:Hint domain-containing protein n=1 Tax=Celeribacter sp. TaxID=1890673 RepID=UPI003A9168B5